MATYADAAGGELAGVVARFAAAIEEGRSVDWERLFVDEPDLAFGVAPDEPDVRCATLSDLWTVLTSHGWGGLYWVHTTESDAGGTDVHRTLTVLDDFGGAIWTGVDRFVLDETGRIAGLQSRDNRLVGLIE